MTAWRFYEVINHFNPLTEDQSKRMKYSKAKTVEVHKLLKQMQSKPEEPYRPEPPQLTPGGPSYRPEPPQFTPGSGQSNLPQHQQQPGPWNGQQAQAPSYPQLPQQNQSKAYVPEAPQFTPTGTSQVSNGGYPTMSGFKMPGLPDMGFTPFSPPAF